MENKINQILSNQILIMEELSRTTRFPHIEDSMKEAIEETTELLKDWIV